MQLCLCTCVEYIHACALTFSPCGIHTLNQPGAEGQIPRVWALSDLKHSFPILPSLLLHLAPNDLSKKEETVICIILMVTDIN